MRWRWLVGLGVATVAFAGALWLGRGIIGDVWEGGPESGPLRPATLAGRLAEIGPRAEARLRLSFALAGVPFPPAEVRLVAFKDQKRLHIFAHGVGTPWRLVRSDPVLAASGGPGPKLSEGDRQVPEGRYRFSALNPNSRFHVSLRLDYPNARDRAQAGRDGRRHLGGDIMIHGNRASIGCLAMGNRVAEDLFVLVARTGLVNSAIVIAPTDLRLQAAPATPGAPAWTSELYDEIRASLRELPAT